MGDLVVGSVAGAGVSELLKVVTEEAKRVRAFKSEYKELASKMDDVFPITEKMERLQGAGERKSLNDTISEARALVDKCSEVKWWNLPAKAINTRKIEEVNKKMLKLCQIQLQFMIYRNQLRNMRPFMIQLQAQPDSAMPTMMNDAVSLGLETVLSKILEGLIEEAKRVTAFKYVYRELASTMEDVRPIIEDIERLPGGAEELEKFKDIIDEARVLVEKCSRVKRWNLPSKAKYSRKIEEFNKKMLDFCQIQLQLAIVQNQLLYRGPVGNCYAKPSPPVYRGPCSVPKLLDKVLVGLDVPLLEIKTKLLDDDDPVCSLVVSAPPGCGKSTLVTQLCHDEEIKDEFEYIFFCNLSKVPTFRNIVRNLLQHNGSEAPTFENDSQAVDGLRNLLDELEEDGPILLVLDDACQGAESLLQKFQINMLNFKILVTSWFEFPSFGPTYHLKPLGDEDAMSLLIKRAPPRFLRRISRKHEDLIQKILKLCYGFPLLIQVFGVQLIRKAVHWMEVRSEEEAIIDIPLPTVEYLTAENIRSSSITDMWMELYDKSSESSTVYVEYLNDLAFLNLYKLVPIWRPGPKDVYFGSSYMWIMWMLVSENLLKVIPSGINELGYSILRDLAQSKYGEHQERKRLNLEIRENKFPDWRLDLRQPISARLLSISTDWMFTSIWVEMDCPNVEALVLNLSSSSYALPNFIATMKKLKVMIIINDGHCPAKLTNLSCLSSLANLKRIRFERISINLLDILLSPLGSLGKLSMFMCSFGEVSYNTEELSIALPSLQEIEIDHCYDLDELPVWVSEVVSLKKLSITNCGKLSVLPKAIGNLSNLEVLRLCSCINLCELPESIERLSNLRFLDISDCLALKKLPSEIGKLQKLKKLSMTMCSGCELPDSVRNLENLVVECDEETGLLWKSLEPEMRNLRVEYSSFAKTYYFAKAKERRKRESVRS